MRQITVKFTTDHDDTLKAVQSVVANLAKAGYVTGTSGILSLEDEPAQEYRFINHHAEIDVTEIDLHQGTLREEASRGKDEDERED